MNKPPAPIGAGNNSRHACRFCNGRGVIDAKKHNRTIILDLTGSKFRDGDRVRVTVEKIEQ